MKLHKFQQGFSAFELVVVVLVLGIVAVVGLRIVGNRNKSPVASTTSAITSSVSTVQVAPPPAVNSTSDLSTAQQTLDQNDPTSSNNADSSQLNTDLSGLN